MSASDMQAGDLSERVTFVRATPVADGGGGSTPTWAPLTECAASVKALTGRERDNAAQVQAPRNYRVTVRRSSETAAVKESDRLIWRGHVMQIRFVPDEGPRSLYLSFDCEAGVNS